MYNTCLLQSNSQLNVISEELKYDPSKKLYKVYMMYMSVQKYGYKHSVII